MNRVDSVVGTALCEDGGRGWSEERRVEETGDGLRREGVERESSRGRGGVGERLRGRRKM